MENGIEFHSAAEERNTETQTESIVSIPFPFFSSLSVFPIHSFSRFRKPFSFSSTPTHPLYYKTNQQKAKPKPASSSLLALLYSPPDWFWVQNNQDQEPFKLLVIMGSSSAQLRLMSDLKTIINEPPEGCSASPMSDDNLFVWSATIFGPDETPWEGGVFSLRLTFSERYPEKPPRVRFTSEMFHPNVYHDGALCMDIIQDAWSPCHNVSTILTSVQSLLTDPNPSSPANPEAAQLYLHDMKAYNKRVRRCARDSIES